MLRCLRLTRGTVACNRMLEPMKAHSCRTDNAIQKNPKRTEIRMRDFDAQTCQRFFSALTG